MSSAEVLVAIDTLPVQNDSVLIYSLWAKKEPIPVRAEHVNRAVVYHICEKYCSPCKEILGSRSLNQSRFILSETKLDAKQTKQLISFFNTRDNFVSRGPETTCCMKFLFAFYTDSVLKQVVQLDDANHIDVSDRKERCRTISPKGMQLFSDFCKAYKINFVNYWPEYYETD